MDYVFLFRECAGLSGGKMGVYFGMEVWGFMDDGFGGLRDFSKGGKADVSLCKEYWR